MTPRFPLIAAAAAAMLMATGAVSADERAVLMVAKPKPQQMLMIAPKRKVGILCPDGWVQAAPPLNWQLGCLPNTLTLGN